MLTILVKIILMLAIPFVSAQTSNPQTYYVAGNKPCASDDNNGLYPDCSRGGRKGPWKTIMHGIPHLRANDILYVRTGTYNEFVDINDANSEEGTADNPITITNYLDETPTITNVGEDFAVRFFKKKYWVFQGFNLDLGQNGGIQIFRSHHIIIRNNTISNGQGPGIEITRQQSEANVIEGNTVFNMWRENEDAHGIIITVNAHDNIIRDNIAFGNSGDGIQVVNTAGNNNQILNNVFYNNRENGIDHKRAEGTIVRGNVVYGHRPSSTSSGAGVVIHVCSKGVVFENNIVYDNTYGLRVQRGMGPRVFRPVDEDGCQLDSGELLPTEDILVQNNIIRDNQETGIRMWQSKNIKVYNNDLIRNGQGIVISEAENTDIKNNILYGDREIDYHVFHGGEVGFSSDYNLFYNSDDLKFQWYHNIYNLEQLQTNTGNGLNSVTGHPMFVSQDDFHLQSGSSAINNAVLNNAPKEDFDGNERIGNPDIGAYEYICTEYDLNCDGEINILDLLEWRRFWLHRDIGADLDENGQINILDYFLSLRKRLVHNF